MAEELTGAGYFPFDSYDHFLGVSVLGHVLAIVRFPPVTLNERETGCDRYSCESWQPLGSMLMSSVLSQHV